MSGSFDTAIVPVPYSALGALGAIYRLIRKGRGNTADYLL